MIKMAKINQKVEKGKTMAFDCMQTNYNMSNRGGKKRSCRMTFAAQLPAQINDGPKRMEN